MAARQRPVAHLVVVTLALAACTARTAPAPAPGGPADAPAARTIRRDIPMTNMIRRAHAAGTRDSTGRPGRNYWQQWVEYTINARLDVPTSSIAGRETIILRNNSDTALRVVWLRLDQNIFAPHAARLNRLSPTSERAEGMKVTRMTVNGQTVNLAPPPRAANVNPAAGGPVASNLDHTIGYISLPNPVPGKGSATIEIDWNFKVPERGIRMGRLADTLYQIAQWYPRVTVYDDLKGWDIEPYLGNSEFYNNFGRFDVSLDVPAGWLVGATGVLQNADAVLSATTRERLARVLESDSVRMIVGANEMGAARATMSGDRLVWRFVADTVNDFAWATSKSYVWDATRATIPGRGPIPVHILYQPGTAQFKQIGPVLRHALEFYSALWFPYAFPHLTTSDGPELGMEYPMFLMSGLGAADHEAGHEWWPMMVSNNETWYGWMDEGFNQYMNALSAAHRRNQPPVLDGPGQAYGQFSGNETESPMMWPANYQTPQFYGFTTYGKAPMMLSMLGAIVGDTAVQRAMSDWAKAWRFKHPSPWDYMFFMSNALGRDLGWFWYYWLFTTEAVNGSIQNVTTAGAQTTVTVRQDGQMPSPVVLRVEFAPTGPAIAPMSNSRMMDSMTAVVTYPVDVWFGGSRTFDATLNFGGRAIQKITLDPFRRFPDRDARDNVWPR